MILACFNRKAGVIQDQWETGPTKINNTAMGGDTFMVKHIVMFKLLEKNEANMEKIINALKTLEGNIDVLRSVEIGVDLTQSERSYDIVLTTEFDDREGLKAYSPHPKHLPVVEIIRPLCSASVVVDYEF